MVADVTRREDVRRVVSESLARFGHIDVWVNNVGQGISRMPSQLTDDDVDDIIKVNIKSALYGMQEVLPHFKERGQGHVINVSSMLGRIPFALIRSAYNGAKHFLNALTANFREEVQQTHPGIQFSLISPGVVGTDFGLTARHGGPDSRSLPNAQTAEDVAAVIADVIETRRRERADRVVLRERRRRPLSRRMPPGRLPERSLYRKDRAIRRGRSDSRSLLCCMRRRDGGGGLCVRRIAPSA